MFRTRKKITLSHRDWEDYQEFRAQRAVDENVTVTSSPLLSIICMMLAGFCVFELPKKFLDINNFNGKCGLIFIILAAVFVIISRAGNFHIDPSDRYGHDDDEHH